MTVFSLATLRLTTRALSVVAALSVASAAPARATDIYDRYGPRAAAPDDDPRYGDVFTHPAPPPARRYAEPRYEEPRYVEPPRDDYVPRDRRDRYGYLAPMNPPRYQDYEGEREPHCLPRAEIKRSLVHEGWRDFHELELRGGLALINARRPNGQLYALRVDRCSGEIVKAKPLHERPVPYAYGDRYGERAY
jgi:hypothetical protein